MTSRKSYGQFCGLARALDRIGDRWTLLVLRELLLGDRSVRELSQALPGISPSLLNQRLATLTSDGLLERNDAAPRSKNVAYRLTPTGQAVEPALLALIRWGGTWMLEGPGDDRVDPRWTVLALRAFLGDGHGHAGILHLDVEGLRLTIDGSGPARAVLPGHHGAAAATGRATFAELLAVASGSRALEDTGIALAGDRDLARDLLRPTVPLPPSGRPGS